jgi:alkylhydroperoxidase family enzyme
MIQIEQTREYKTYLLNKSLNQQAKRMAVYLMTTLFIDPHNYQLAAAIQPEIQQDNAELVLGWVRQQLCCISCMQEVEFKELQRDFVRWLLNHDIPVGELQ